MNLPLEVKINIIKQYIGSSYGLKKLAEALHTEPSLTKSEYDFNVMMINKLIDENDKNVIDFEDRKKEFELYLSQEIYLNQGNV